MNKSFKKIDKANERQFKGLMRNHHNFYIQNRRTKMMRATNSVSPRQMRVLNRPRTNMIEPISKGCVKYTDQRNKLPSKDQIKVKSQTYSNRLHSRVSLLNRLKFLNLSLLLDFSTTTRPIILNRMCTTMIVLQTMTRKQHFSK